ncbi:sulfatase [Engelhardtia mirabilis]|uniref:Choline-sulfatase n=1 Tax=Engelhardtia mirabilis TaxID=2528011 RepID=A0A518BSI6_9BACT|nr:Choline-sulfatase [Planctomycetes bacterium Pla133]QDV04261.1 Choline-sulfatase [Planctomycetes bacterium Pla86]
MLRTSALLTVILAAPTGVALPAAEPSQDGERAARPAPNILFVLADDLGWGDPSCYGNPDYDTPNIDQLAAQGSLFTNFYAAAPTCSPSRAAFMSGRFPAELAIHGPLHVDQEDDGVEWLDARLPNVANVLASAGYRTAHFGKWHLGAPAEGAPTLEEYGFDRARIAKRWDGERSLWRTDRAGSSRQIVDEALDFIDAEDERPFYAQLWLLDPHAPLSTEIPRLENYAVFGPPSGNPPGAKALYAAHVGELDVQLGRLMNALSKRRLNRNTIVIFASDNGPEVQDIRNASYSAAGSSGPFRGTKRSLYEGGLRVPLIVRWPGRVPAGRIEREAVVSGVDFLPTLARMGRAELTPETELDGEDVSDVFFGASRPRGTPLFYESRVVQQGRYIDRSPSLGLRDGEWMLLLEPDGGRTELFNLVRDPVELRNLAEAEAERLEALRAAALEWFAGLAPRDPAGSLGLDPWPWVVGR